VDTATGFDPESWGRLREVRAALDPTGVFLAGHEIR
jgi:FAD/FMN-containing dehydrogenase